MSVAKFPRRFHHRAIVKAAEMYAQPEPPDEMVWAVCPHLRTAAEDKRCSHCPKWEDDPDYGKLQRGCYALAKEACMIVFAMQARKDTP
jgi:hypothetical protein